MWSWSANQIYSKARLLEISSQMDYNEIPKARGPFAWKRQWSKRQCKGRRILMQRSEYNSGITPLLRSIVPIISEAPECSFRSSHTMWHRNRVATIDFIYIYKYSRDMQYTLYGSWSLLKKRFSQKISLRTSRQKSERLLIRSTKLRVHFDERLPSKIIARQAL